MGSKGGGGSSNMGFSAGTSTYTPNPEAMAAFRQALSMAENVASIPYQPYTGQMVAGFSPDQMASFQATRNMQGMMQPYTNAGLGMLSQAVNYSDPRLFNQQTLSQYQNPYQSQVVDATMANLRELQSQGEQQSRTRAATQGTFGGSGEFRGRAEIARQQAMANAQTLAGLQQQGYSQAINQYNQQQQQAISTAQNAAYGLGQLGNQAQQASLQGIQALLGTGGMQQQLAQGQLTGAYNQFLQQRAYPYQQAAFYSGIASGIAPSMGGTTNTVGFNMGQAQQQQQGGGGGAATGVLSSVLSFLPMLGGSDERTKTNIEPWGEPDPETGLQAYSYDDIGDLERSMETGKPMPPKRVSYMAQDIEEVSPESVLDLGGLKTIEMPRSGKADGGAQSIAGLMQGMGGSGGGAYAAPSAPSLPSGSASQAGGQSLGVLGTPTQGAPLDPGLSQFLQGAFDPQTADKIARSKWVNQPQAPGEVQDTSDNYVIPPGLMGDGGDSYPYHPARGQPKAYGGRTERAVGGGSFFDLIKKGGIQGPYSDAPDNYMASAQEIGIGKIIPKAPDVAKDITKSSADAAMRDAEQASKQAAKDQSGRGGSGGGGGGSPKMPSMKGSGKSAVPAQKPAPGPSAAKIDAALQSESPATPTSQEPSVGPGAQEAAKGDFNFAQNAAPLPDPSPVVEQMGGMGAPEMPPMQPMQPPVMPAIEPQIPLLGLFGGFADGGRISKDSGGSSSGFANLGEGSPSSLTEGAPAGYGMNPIDSGINSPIFDGGFGDIVLGKAKSPAEAAGFGNLIKGQETLTGENLMNKLTKQYWERDPGVQTSPTEQGMPAMPDAKHYTTPRKSLPGKLMSENFGKENQSEVPGMLAMMGGQGMGGVGLAMMINQQQRAADAKSQQQALQAERASMLADPANYPVEGYFTELSSTPAGKPEMGMQLNPRTGLYNVKYTGAYRGMPYKDGGSVPMAAGGEPRSYAPTDKDLDYWARTVLREAGNQGRIGMEAVAHVIKNRLESGKFGKSIVDVVTAPKQFSPWNRENVGKAADPRRVNPESEGYKKALDIVKRVASGESKSPVGTSTHFANPAAVKSAYHGRIPQKWLRSMMADPSTVRIGQHIFNTTGAGAQDQSQKYAINLPSRRNVPYQPEARPLAFKPKEAAPAVVAENRPAIQKAELGRADPPRGSVLNYINPKDPSGPLLSSAAPTAAPRMMADSDVTAAVGRGERIKYDAQGNAIGSEPRGAVANPLAAERPDNSPRPRPAAPLSGSQFSSGAMPESGSEPDFRKAYYESIGAGSAPKPVPAAAPAPMPITAPAMPHKSRGFSLGDLSPISSAQAGDRGVYPSADSSEAPGMGRPYNPAYDYAPGVPGESQRGNLMTDFGKTARQGFVDNDLSQGFFQSMPMSQSPLGPFSENSPEIPGSVVSENTPEKNPAESRKAPGKMYWGDYRDAENNPFGDFIDEFAGDVRKSPTAGTANMPMGKFSGEGGLGQIFDLEGTLPPDFSHNQPEVNAPDQAQGFDFGSLFDMFG